MTIAQTPFFTPAPGLNLRQALAQWSLLDDLDLDHRGDGTVAFIAKGGASQWPAEWTPDGEVVVDFDLAQFLGRVFPDAPLLNPNPVMPVSLAGRGPRVAGRSR